MWPDGKLERFDERFVMGVDPQYANQVDPNNGLILRQQYSRNATLADLPDFINATLQTFQAYYIPQEYSDPWRGYMPYAFYIEPGMKLFNIRTQAQYTIDEVFVDKDGDRTGEVLLSGATSDADPPEATDTLIFDKSCGIRFSRATPRSTEGVDYEATAERKDTVSAWQSWVDYSVLEEAPAVTDPSAAQRMKIGVKPLYRESVETGDPHIVEERYGQWFDARVRLDLWGATGDQAEKLVYWFLKYFRLNYWVFQYNGIQQMLFLKRGIDQPVGVWRSRLYHRSLDFFVRTEHQFSAQFRRLDHINVSVRLRQDSFMEALEADLTGRPSYTGLAPTIRYINE